MKKKVVALLALTGIFSGQTMAQSCQALVELQTGAVKEANRLFEGSPNRFSIVVCNNQGKAIYRQFYAQIHFERTRALSIPTAGLSPVNAPLQPDNRSKTTGLIAAEDESANQFSIKLRTRYSNGDAVDYSATKQITPGQSVIFEDQGFTVGVVRLGGNKLR